MAAPNVTTSFVRTAVARTTVNGQATRLKHGRVTRRRCLHDQSPRRSIATAVINDSASSTHHAPSTTRTSPSVSAPRPSSEKTLQDLPLSQILRTYLITSVSSNPTLLDASSRALKRMLDSNNPVFDLRNPVMRKILWETFYKQFCAGENKKQVEETCHALRQQGYAGVILEYALEVLKDAQTDELADIEVWKKGMLDTVDMSTSGDFLAFKWSGMGPAAMRRMKNEQPPSREMVEAMHAVCKAGAAKNVALLPAAEETWSLTGFHNWCLMMMREYNTQGKSVVYSTYQAYLKQNPAILARHLQMAKDEGFVLGVKLVRGAYLATEKRDLIWPNIEGTHHSYDSTTSALVHRKYNDFLRPAGASDAFPDVNVVIASHNAQTANKTQMWRRQQAERGETLTPLVFAQLQGMADEISCALLAASKAEENPVKERILKYTTWGTMDQCLNYLLRRAGENKEAATRTVETRDAMRDEVTRRLRSVVGLN